MLNSSKCRANGKVSPGSKNNNTVHPETLLGVLTEGEDPRNQRAEG